MTAPDTAGANKSSKTYRTGVFHSIVAAFFFGCGMPLAKLLLDAVPADPRMPRLDPLILSGLLYLGSGVGLEIGRRILTLFGSNGLRDERNDPIRGRAWLWLFVGTSCSGLIAPPLLMWGLANSTASESSLLLSLESVFTAGLAWAFFREHWNRRILVGIGFVVAGATALSFHSGQVGLHLSWGCLAVAGATLGWGIDNNCTRKIADCGAVRLAVLKGFGAGVILLTILLSLDHPLPSLGVIALAMLLGTFSIGLCQAQMILSMQVIGAARMAAWFSLAPFFGAVLSFLLLHDPLTLQFVIASALTAFGLWLHATEGGAGGAAVDKQG